MQDGEDGGEREYTNTGMRTGFDWQKPTLVKKVTAACIKEVSVEQESSQKEFRCKESGDVIARGV